MHLTVVPKNCGSFGVNKESLAVFRECKYGEQRQRALIMRRLAGVLLCGTAEEEKDWF